MEAMDRKVQQLRAKLTADGATPLESMLIDRLCLDWLATQACDITRTNAIIERAPPACIKAASQQLDAATGRFHDGLKTLATLRKALRPTISTLDLLRPPAAKPAQRRSKAARDVIPLEEGAPVVN